MSNRYDRKKIATIWDEFSQQHPIEAEQIKRVVEEAWRKEASEEAKVDESWIWQQTGQPLREDEQSEEKPNNLKRTLD